jgi:hypothetical protein
MEWRWGNIGSILQCLSVVVIAIAALIRSPAALRNWQARQAAEADAARARAEASRAEAEAVRLERHRTLLGWSPHAVQTYTVALVTDLAGLEQATQELSSGGPTSYVVLRVDEGEGTSVNRARPGPGAPRSAPGRWPRSARSSAGFRCARSRSRCPPGRACHGLGARSVPGSAWPAQGAGSRPGSGGRWKTPRHDLGGHRRALAPCGVHAIGRGGTSRGRTAARPGRRSAPPRRAARSAARR